MVRPTSDRFLAPNATPDDVRKAILRVADEIRRFGAGEQANRLEEIVEYLTPPTLDDVEEALRPPHAWPTFATTERLIQCIKDAAEIIDALLADAEITGSYPSIHRAKAWLDELGIKRDDR